MQSSIALSIGLPVALWIIMLGLGLSLRLEDFVRVLALAFSLTSMSVGYWVPKMLNIERSQAVALSMSIGLHNAALVIALAMSEHMLNDPEMAIPPAAYGLIAYVVGGLFVWKLNRGQQASSGANLSGYT